MPINLYNTILPATFLDRPNRFVCHAEVEGAVETCHMPNPGRMRELLFRGSRLFVTPYSGNAHKTKFRVVGVEKDGCYFYLDTSKTNDVAAYLIAHHQIPGWEDCVLAGREVTMGDSRFDLLLTDTKTGETFPVEVKSCSLSGKEGAMFPDAPTLRGLKHLRHLVQTGKDGGRAGLLVMVHYEKAHWFLPDLHTDPDFAAALAEGLPYLEFKAACVKWDRSFTMPAFQRLLPTSTDAVKAELGNHGDYMVVLYLSADKDIEIGKKGVFHFPAGYYVYVGSAKQNLIQRLAHHRHLRKRMHWHLDYLRRETEWVGEIPIRTAEDLEHDLARAVGQVADWTIPHFGNTDCQKDGSHLFGFHENPMHLKRFLALEEWFEIDRLGKWFSLKAMSNEK